MKPELTLELKSRFCALYYGQRVLFHDQGSSIGSYAQSHWNVNEDWYLQLRLLSSITDEEAIEIAKSMWPLDKTAHTSRSGSDFIKSYVAYGGRIYIEVADYLRSIGVALPFMGYSVDELVEAGWIKLVAEEVAQS